MATAAELPDFEVVLRLHGSEAAILAGFRRASGIVDILIGVDDSALRYEYADVIEQCVLAIRTAGNWTSLPHSHVPKPPF